MPAFPTIEHLQIFGFVLGALIGVALFGPWSKLWRES